MNYFLPDCLLVKHVCVYLFQLFRFPVFLVSFSRSIHIFYGLFSIRKSLLCCRLGYPFLGSWFLPKLSYTLYPALACHIIHSSAASSQLARFTIHTHSQLANFCLFPLARSGFYLRRALTATRTTQNITPKKTKRKKVWLKNLLGTL